MAGVACFEGHYSEDGLGSCWLEVHLLLVHVVLGVAVNGQEYAVVDAAVGGVADVVLAEAADVVEDAVADFVVGGLVGIVQAETAVVVSDEAAGVVEGVVGHVEGDEVFALDVEVAAAQDVAQGFWERVEEGVVEGAVSAGGPVFFAGLLDEPVGVGYAEAGPDVAVAEK